jgi:hypothetical protein
MALHLVILGGLFHFTCSESVSLKPDKWCPAMNGACSSHVGVTKCVEGLFMSKAVEPHKWYSYCRCYALHLTRTRLVTCQPALVDDYMTTSPRFQVVSLYNLEADQKLGTGCDSCCIVRRYC